MNNSNLLSNNLILNTDTYKTSHWAQLPDGSTNMYSYIESRGTDTDMTEVVQWGLQAIIKKFLMTPITERDVIRAKRFVDHHIQPGIFNYDGWMHIVDNHEGRLPLKIRALPEGTVIPLRNVMVTVESTDPACAWLVSYFEPLLLQMWYGSTVASISYDVRKRIEAAFDRTVDEDRREQIAFKFHDFGFRGASSVESAEIGAAGHLLSFLGTDTMRAVASLYDYYNLDEEDDASMPAFSVEASEHSVSCANSDADKKNDRQMLEKMISRLEQNGGIVSVVADTYDVYRFTKWACEPEIQERVKNSGGALVLRPDSGDPLEVPIKVIEILLEGYGYTINTKGYKVLPDHIRVLQGDGINQEMIQKILDKMESLGISAENIVFGAGGALLQHCDRDWFKFAMKGSSLTIDGKQKDLYKDPITDSVKRSKKGRVTTFKDKDGNYFSDRIELQDVNTKIVDQLVTVYENGELLVDEDFGTIRQRVLSNFR